VHVDTARVEALVDLPETAAAIREFLESERRS
jgi:hypothetical protein